MSEISIFRSLNLERTLIYQNFFLWKSVFFHPIKLPFDAKAAEKFLKVIYCLMTISKLSEVFSRFSISLQNRSRNQRSSKIWMRLKKGFGLIVRSSLGLGFRANQRADRKWGRPTKNNDSSLAWIITLNTWCNYKLLQNNWTTKLKVKHCWIYKLLYFFSV